MPITVESSPPAGVTYVQVVLDPTTEGTGTELTYVSLGDLIEHSAPMAPLNPLYASSFDTEGDIPVDLKYGNGEIVDKLVVRGSTAAELEAKLGQLFRKLGKINREGGTYKRTTVTGTVSIYDLCPEAEGGLMWDIAYLAGNAATVDLRYVRKPFWRSLEVDMGTNSETTLPALVFVEAGPGGDVLALGRELITEGSTADQGIVLVGLQSQHYSADATAKLQYEAEAFIVLGTTTKATGVAGASGTAPNVMRNTDLVPAWQAILKSEIDATNAALTHEGSFRIWARVYRPTTNTGAVSVRLEWECGDFRKPARNDPVMLPADSWEGQWTLVDLGLVHLTGAARGDHRWEFRVLAKSTATGDEIDIDHFLLFPTSPEKNYIELSGRWQFETPSAFSARDEFDHANVPLTGLTAPVGGVWAGAGDADDYTVNTTLHVASRSAVSDANAQTGRYAISGVAAFASQAVQVDSKVTPFTPSPISDNGRGVLARYTDTNNWLAAVWRESVTGEEAGSSIVVRIRVAGTVEQLARLKTPINLIPDTYYSTRLYVDSQGRWAVWWWQTDSGAPSSPLLVGQDNRLATAGALATGKPGIYDFHTAPNVRNRYYDNFFAFVPTVDAAIFAGQSLELRHDGAEREDSAGMHWQNVSERRGKYLKIPPAGQEGRANRIIVKAARGPTLAPGVILDPALDDISAQLFVTPRGLVAPEA